MILIILIISIAAKVTMLVLAQSMNLSSYKQFKRAPAEHKIGHTYTIHDNAIEHHKWTGRSATSRLHVYTIIFKIRSSFQTFKSCDGNDIRRWRRSM